MNVDIKIEPTSEAAMCNPVGLTANRSPIHLAQNEGAADLQRCGLRSLMVLPISPLAIAVVSGVVSPTL